MTIKATIKSSNGLQQQGEFDNPPFTGITGKINMDVPQPDGTIKNRTLDIPYINGRYNPPQYVVQVMKRADGSTYNVRVLVQASGSIDPPLKGWERRGDNYYYNGEQVNPQDYLYPDGDRPAYSICVGSQYYDAYYRQRWSDRWIASGVNIADWNYVIPTQWTVASGNDIWAQVEGIDGRTYAAQLINRSIDGAAGYMGTSPQLQYSDDDGRTWAQYFRPIDQVRFKERGWITGPHGRVWTGNFHIFQADATVAGRDFKRGEVIYSAVNVQHESGGQRMWGVDTSNKCACFWAVAKTINHEPYDGGVIIVRPPFVGDPRIVVWNGNMYLGTNGNGVMNTNYSITPVLTLRSQNTAIVGAPTNPMTWEMENPTGRGNNNYECPAFSVVKDSVTGSNRLMFGFSVQLVRVFSEWNTIANQNYFNLLSSPQSSGTAASCVAFDVGKDSYATSLGAPDLMVPSTRGIVAFSAMNWGSPPNTYPGNSAYPQRFFGIANGYLRYEADADGHGGWQSIAFDPSKRVYIKRNGSVKTQLHAADQGSYTGRVDVDYDATSLNEFGWKTTDPRFPYVTNNLAHNVPYNKIVSIDWKQSGAALVLILRAASGYHDSTCGFCFVHFNAGDILSVSQTG